MTPRRATPPPLPELTRWQIILGIVLGLAIPGATFAAAWGNTNARITALEKHADTTVTRAELQAVSGRLDELVSEVRGLRQDLITVYKDRR